MLPFENLTADPALDWAGAAISGVLASEMSGSPRIAVNRAGSSREAALEGADQVLQGYFEKRGSQLRFAATIQDLTSSRAVKYLETSAAPNAIVAAAGDLAREAGGRTRPFGTQSAEAVQAWGEAQLAGDPAARSAALERSITADPNFGAAYADLVQVMIPAGRRDEAAQVLERARPRLVRFTDVDRARVELADAELKGDLEERRRALVALSRLVSADAGVLRQLAEINLQRRDFAAAADLYRSALRVQPDSPDLLNGLGYCEAYRGNLDEARTALERYRTLQPDQLNPIDSLGDVHYFLGRFDEAEKYFTEAQQRNPAFLGGLEFAKAAQCRLMKGDLAGADQLFAKYTGPVDAAHPAALIRQAQWLYMTGRLERGRELLAAAAAPATATYAAAQETIWNLQAGDSDRARATAARCAAGGNPALAAICMALVDRNSAVPAPIREMAAAYRPLLARDYAAALPPLKRDYERITPGTDGDIRTLYAWSLIASGKVSEAAPLVQLYPFPVSGGDLLFSSLTFPRFLDVRAAVLKQQGKTDEAGRLHDLFLRYSGKR